MRNTKTCYKVQNYVAGVVNFLSNLKAYGGVFDLAGKETRLAEIAEYISSPDAWANQSQMTIILKEKSRLEEEVAEYKSLEMLFHDMEEWLQFLDEGEEEARASLEEQAHRLKKVLSEVEVSILLADEADHMDAIVDIHPGAGGTEAQDWAAMLERMYMRYADSKKLKVEILDYLAGEEAGTKSITMRIQGQNAYGFLKGEKGIHRLIRISPFDSSGRRHTSFASVDVMADAGDEITIIIKDEDIRIDVYRASGAGGQHVNKTESAVRITHIPTGIVAQCQNEKSQHNNKDSAMRILKSRLYQHELNKREALRQADYAGKDSIAFGSQIRTYTMQPYRLVKDHRTMCEVGDVDAVLDGKLQDFIRSYLLYSHEKKVQK